MGIQVYWKMLWLSLYSMRCSSLYYSSVQRIETWVLTRQEKKCCYQFHFKIILLDVISIELVMPNIDLFSSFISKRFKSSSTALNDFLSRCSVWNKNLTECWDFFLFPLCSNCIRKWIISWTARRTQSQEFPESPLYCQTLALGSNLISLLTVESCTC